MIIKRFIFIVLFYQAGVLFSQSSEGKVTYEYLILDSRDSIVSNLSDSLGFVYTHIFKDGYFRTTIGDPSNQREIILNSEGYYITHTTSSERSYSFQPINFNLFSNDTLLNYADTNSIVTIKLDELKVIKGYECKKAILKLGGSDDFPLIIWYTDEIKGNNLIFGVGSAYANLNGLILETCFEHPNGKTTIRAKTIELSTINIETFQPNLTDYTRLNPN